ncbi:MULTISPECIES: hypothetical protein [Chryseobacterium]|uniref:hypothetical protein n=1 Tax=Chryseobacterium sp. R2A-55 TaxID=2744445 RepID=UPI001F34BADD|nr:hypothetical protein [Chryseobacterium sp. R2A-55]
MAKEDIPFELLDILDPIVKSNKDKVSISHFLNDKNELVFDSNNFKDKFYFKINYKLQRMAQVNNASKNVYLVTYYPYTENKLKEYSAEQTADNIKQLFTNWLSYLDKYENTSTFLDDPLIEAYQKDIFKNTLKFLPEPDDDKPYPLMAQMNFIDYLENLENIIKEEISSNKNQEDKKNLKHSLKHIENIKENINKLSKGEIKSKFSLSLAYIAKASLKFFTQLTAEIVKEVAVKGIIGS